jgi:hypothetical protein
MKFKTSKYYEAKHWNFYFLGYVSTSEKTKLKAVCSWVKCRIKYEVLGRISLTNLLLLIIILILIIK